MSRLLPHQTVTLLAEPFAGANLGGHLAFDTDGTRLLANNRGHDSIAVFDILADGTLRRGPLASSGGQSPRQFRQSGEELLIVNEESGNIRRLRRDGQGRWALAGGPLRVAGAAFIVTDGLVAEEGLEPPTRGL